MDDRERIFSTKISTILIILSLLLDTTLRILINHPRIRSI